MTAKNNKKIKDACTLRALQQTQCTTKKLPTAKKTVRNIGQYVH